MPQEVSLYIYDDTDTEMPEPDTPEFWVRALNDRAEEFGLDRNVMAVIPKFPGDAYIWIFENENDELIELGWNIEGAEKTLKSLAGQTELG